MGLKDHYALDRHKLERTHPREASSRNKSWGQEAAAKLVLRNSEENNLAGAEFITGTKKWMSERQAGEQAAHH